MEEILIDLGLGQCVQKFEQQKVSPSHVPYLTDTDFQFLGVLTIGDKIRLKEKCREHTSACQPVSVCERVELFQKERKRRKGVTLSNSKKTRRIHVGWKHRNNRLKPFHQVTQNKGGGTIYQDVEKNESLIDLEEKILASFLPNGVNTEQKLKIENLDWFIANFTGVKISLFSSDGEPVLVSTLLKSIPSSPVRIYLHTQPKSECSTATNDRELTSGTQLQVTADAMQPSCISAAPIPQSSTTPAAETQPCSTPALVSESSIAPVSQQSQSNFISSQFTNAGTPTVQLRQRRSLSLSRRDVQRPIYSPVETVEVFDSEDEEISRAVEASIHSVVADNESSHTEAATLTDVLKSFQEKAISEDTRSTVIVSRSCVLKSAFTAMSRPTFNPRGRLYVKFSGEIGEDYGGPRREFFRLAMRELQMSNLFEGPDDSRYFSHDVDSLQRKQYFLAGQLVALSLAHDGPAFCCLNEHLFEFMVGNESVMIDSGQVLPGDVQKVITELRAISTEPDRERFLVNHGDWLIDQGLVNIFRLTLQSKEEYAMLVQKQWICFRTHAEISQFINGMDTLDVWELLKGNSSTFKSLFCLKPSSLTREDFDSLCNFVRSDVGSNNSTAEDTTIYAWEIFLQDIEDKVVPVSFEELLQFITGADTVPSMGFSKKIDVMFFNQEQGLCRLPHTSTCVLQIWLPRGADTLDEILVRAIKESHGFHKI